MLTVSIMLAVCSMIIEQLIMCKIPGFRTVVSGNFLLNVIVSLGLSWILGEVFDAKGVTVLTAAMLSTAGSSIIYRVLRLSDSTRRIYRGTTQRVRRRA